MNTRQLFKRRVIELIHGLPYEDCIEKELGFGAIVEFFSTGIWGHRANHYFAKVFSEKYSLINGERRNEFIMSKCGFQELGKGWKSEKKPEEWCIYFDEKGKLTGFGVFEIINIQLPITIGRVMKALKSIGYFGYEYGYIVGLGDYDCTVCEWKLTNEDGSDCTDDYQTDETIEKLYNLIK